jgi:alkylhydroperoxidase/carboxymuconolactone decarboxylase family protein YurZ
MKGSLNGAIPNVVKLASEKMPEMVYEQIRSNQFSMPENGALENETRTLIYLGVALATGSKTCIKAMLKKAKAQKISKDKLVETYKSVRYAESSRILGNAEQLFEEL